jgi:hypothetical protein
VTADAAERLRDALGDLSGGDRAELADVVGLLNQADEQHDTNGQDPGNEPASGTSTTSEQDITTTSVVESPSTSSAADQPTVVIEPTATTSTTENPGETTTTTTLSPDSSGITTATGAQVNP